MLHHFREILLSLKSAALDQNVRPRDVDEGFLDWDCFGAAGQQNGCEGWNSSCRAVNGPAAKVPFSELSGCLRSR